MCGFVSCVLYADLSYFMNLIWIVDGREENEMYQMESKKLWLCEVLLGLKVLRLVEYHDFGLRTA